MGDFFLTHVTLVSNVFFLFIILQDIIDKLCAINRIHMFQTISEYVGGHDIWRMENCSSKDYP